MNKDKLYDDVLDAIEKIMDAMKVLLTEEPEAPGMELSELAAKAARKADVSAYCALKVLRGAAEVLGEGRKDD